MRVELPRVLTPALADELGISRSHVRTELRRDRWQRLAAGVVLTRRGEPERLDWAAAGLACGGVTAALSGWDACRLFGAGDRRPPAASVLVLVREARSRSFGGVLIRRTDRPYVTSPSSMYADLPSAPVVALPRAVADAALAMTRLDSVRALVASAIRTGRCAPADLASQLAGGPRGGSRLLRIAIDEMSGGARSAAEARALAELTRARVPSFEFNVPVVDRAGRVRWVLDVLWRELRAVLEIDSAEYHFGPRAWEATMARHNALQRYGLAVTHHPPAHITRAPAAWRAEVEQWLRARSVELAVPYRVGRLIPAEPYLL